MAISDINAGEIKVLVCLMSNGPSSAEDISRNIGLERAETYNLLSSLLSRGIVFSIPDRPQSYCVLCQEEVTDLMMQSKKNFNEILEGVKDRCASLLAELKGRAAAGS